MPALRIPLASSADHALRRLAHATGAAALAALDAATLLGERAMHAGLVIAGTSSARGHCRLLNARGDCIALNLARPADRELLPALFECDALDAHDDHAIAAHVARSDAAALLRRGRSMGLAMAAEHEARQPSANACVELVAGAAAAAPRRPAPRVLDLSALWAGPLSAHLLWLAGGEVMKVESRTRPDAMRDGDPALHALLNQGKASVVLDFADAQGRQALIALIKASDIVIEAARPRALLQLGIDAAQLVRSTPGLVWMSITAHGAQDEAAEWIGFGDDCAVAGGLSAALRQASGRAGLVGDAMADPLTGIFTALAAWEQWSARRGGRFALAMSQVVAHCLADARARDAAALAQELRAWSAAVGQPYPAVTRRAVGGRLSSLGEDTRTVLAMLAPC